MCRFVFNESIENALHWYSPLVAPAGMFELRYPPKNDLKQNKFFYKKIENTKRDANLECIPNSTTYLNPGSLKPPVGPGSNPKVGRKYHF